MKSKGTRKLFVALINVATLCGCRSAAQPAETPKPTHVIWTVSPEEGVFDAAEDVQILNGAVDWFFMSYRGLIGYPSQWASEAYSPDVLKVQMNGEYTLYTYEGERLFEDTYKCIGNYMGPQGIMDTSNRYPFERISVSDDVLLRWIDSDTEGTEPYVDFNVLSEDYRSIKEEYLHAPQCGDLGVLPKVNFIQGKDQLEDSNGKTYSVAEAEDAGFAYDIKINIYDEQTYYSENHERITPLSFENKKYIFDLETITQITYLAHIGEFSFKNYGAHENKGTYILSMSGDIISTNIYEFEMYTPIKNIIRAAGGTIKDYSIKCVFTNGFLNPPIDFISFQNMTLDYECFNSFNMNIGNGGICFIREDRCMVRVILKIVQFAKSISCGKCMPCHYGFDLCEYYINKMLLGNSDNEDYINLKETLEMINTGSICLYIKKLSYCILSSIDMFRDEFLYLIENKVTLYSFIKD